LLSFDQCPIEEAAQTAGLRYSGRPDFGLAHPLLYDWRSVLCLLKSTAVTTLASIYNGRGKALSGIHFALLLLMFIPSLRQSPAAQSQPGSEKLRTATVSGRVILNGEPLGGVTIQFLPKRGSVKDGREEPHRAVADEQGRYRITGIPAGVYRVDVPSDEFLIAGGLGYIKRQNMINILEGEKVEQFDLVLKRGGSITGRVIDADGRPLTGQVVDLTLIGDDGRPQRSPYSPAAPRMTVVVGSGYTTGETSFSYNVAAPMMTDEQGVYRMALLPEGHYLVSSGMTESARWFMRTEPSVYYPQTYHPGVSDPSKARVVEIHEGAETSGVDIVIAGAMKTYNIKGRVVNAETGNPVEGIGIHYTGQAKDGGLPVSDLRKVRSNADGEFQFQGVLPGKYKIYPVKSGTNEYFSEPALCEITDGDAGGVEIKLRPGGSISGEVIIEGAKDPLTLAAQEKPPRILIGSVSKDTKGAVLQRVTTKVNADGSFRIAGLRPGKLYLDPVQDPFSSVYWIKRVELGAQGERIIADGLEIGPGENVSNVRVFLSYGSRTLRGEVKIIGGDIPSHMGIDVYLYRLNKSESGNTQFAFVDKRGQFVFSNLIPGEYEVRLSVILYQPSKPMSRPMDDAISKLILKTRQTVSIGGAGTGSESGEATVTLVIDLSQKEGN
jgi:protocatechuate 3,4-dioxygenase beta subunit